MRFLSKFSAGNWVQTNLGPSWSEGVRETLTLGKLYKYWSWGEIGHTPQTASWRQDYSFHLWISGLLLEICDNFLLGRKIGLDCADMELLYASATQHPGHLSGCHGNSARPVPSHHSNQLQSLPGHHGNHPQSLPDHHGNHPQSQHSSSLLQQPLWVDTSIQYEIDWSRFSEGNHHQRALVFPWEVTDSSFSASEDDSGSECQLECNLDQEQRELMDLLGKMLWEIKYVTIVTHYSCYWH